MYHGTAYSNIFCKKKISSLIAQLVGNVNFNCREFSGTLKNINFCEDSRLKCPFSCAATYISNKFLRVEPVAP